MGCADKILDPIGGSIANSLGMNTPMDYLGAGFGGTAFLNYGHFFSMVKEDWTAIKHLLVPDMRRDREAMTNGALTNRRVVYGTCRVSGQLAYAESAGSKNEFLHLIVILASHPVTSIQEIYLDDKLASEYGTDVEYKLFNGTQTTACAEMIAASAGKWTADHKLLGCTYIYLKLTYNETSFASGLPTVKVVLNGKPLYDPRTGLTTGISDPNVKVVVKPVDDQSGGYTGWNDNPALCIRDYMLTPEEQGGMGCTTDEIDDTAIIAAANICDQWVYKTTDGTQQEKRFTCSGTFEINSTPKRIVDALLQSMAGTALFIQGKWQIFPGACGTTTGLVTLDESWLNGGIGFKIGANKSEKINTIKGTFIDPDDHWAAKGFPPVTSATYIAEDGNEELSEDVTLNFTISPSMAQRLGKIIMEQSRRALQVDYPCNFKAFALTPHQLVRVDNTQLGWSQKLMRVVDWEFGGAGGIKLTLIEEDPEIYDWLPGDVVEIPEVPLTILPDPWVVTAPTNLTATESLYTGVALANTKSKLTLGWVSTSPAGTQFEVAVGGTIIQIVTEPLCIIPDLAPGSYDISVRAKNSIGAVSPWVSIVKEVLGKVASPANVTGFSAVFAGNLIKLSWAANTDIDLAGYEIRVGASWAAGTVLLAAYMGNGYTYRPSVTGTITYWIKAWDTAGNESAAAATASAVIPDVDVPTAIAATPQFLVVDLLITYDLSRQDTSGVEIWAASTNDRNTAVMVGLTRDGRWQHQGLANAAFRYYWARCISVFEQAGAWFPSNASAGVLGATLNDPSQAIKLLNPDVDSAKLADYLAGNTSLVSVFDTHPMLFELGVVGPGVVATYTDALSQAASQMNSNQTLLQYLNNTVAGLTVTAYSAAATYETGQIVTYNTQTYQCIQTSTGNLPTVTAYWSPISGLYQMVTAIRDDLDAAAGTWDQTALQLTADVDDLDNPSTGRVTLAESTISQQGDKISLQGTAITGPLAFVVGAVTQPGVVVETAADIAGIDTAISRVGIDLDTANANIMLSAGRIDNLTGRVTTAEVLIDGANAAIALRATKEELSGQVSILSDAIGLKVSSADYNSQIVLLNNAIGLKASSSTVDALTGVVNTKAAQIDLNAANAAIALKASSLDLSGQVDILTDMIGLKLNATGTVGPGLAISWTDAGHTKSLIRVQTDLFQVGDNNGAGFRNIFSVGNINGTPTVGISGDLVIDGTLTARSLVADTAMVNFLNARGIVAGSVAAENISGTTITGKIFQTTASTSSDRVLIDSVTNRQYFTGLNRISGGTYRSLCSFGSTTLVNTVSGRSIIYAGDDSTGVTYLGGGAIVDTATASDLIGVCGVSALATGVQGGSVSGAGVAGYSQKDGVLGYGWRYGIVAETKSGVTPGTAPLRLVPSASASAPSHAADIGALWVTATGILYINTSGSTTWQKVGAQ